MSLVEAITGTVVGFVVAMAAQMVVFPLVGIEADMVQNLAVAGSMTVVSILRGYLLRRGFEAYRLGSKPN